MINRSISSLVALTIIGVSSSAFASGFQLFEGNATSTANFGAGGAAIAEDASTSTYNPAGLTRIKRPQIVLSGVGVAFNTNFNGSVTWNDVEEMLPPHTETGSTSSDKFTAIPAVHIAVPFYDRWVASFSVTAPFGLITEYDDQSLLRYAATRTKLVTIDYSPALAFKVNDTLSIGAGADYQYAKVHFDSVAGLPIIPNLGPFAFDTMSRNTGHDYAWGWHAGALLNFNKESTRVGVNYQSGVSYHLTGDSEFSGVLANGTDDGVQISPNLMSHIRLPSTTTLSVFQNLNPKWSVMGSAIYTNWSVFKKIKLDNVAGLLPPDTANNTFVVTADENYSDTWRFVGGVDYQARDKLLLRAGLGYDQTPVNNHDRDVRLPDGDRIATSVGFSYQVTDNANLEVGYTHLFIRSSNINNSIANGNPVSTGSPAGINFVGQTADVIGHSKDRADLIGVQLRLNLA